MSEHFGNEHPCLSLGRERKQTDLLSLRHKGGQKRPQGEKQTHVLLETCGRGEGAVEKRGETRGGQVERLGVLQIQESGKER